MITAKFCGVDWWSRAIFRAGDRYFTCTDILIGGSKEERAEQLRTIIDKVNSGQLSIDSKGSDFEDEPIGSVPRVFLTSDIEYP